MKKRRRGPGRRCDCAPAGEGGEVATARTSQPWWQGGWQALGGLFNLLAALAGRWPRNGS